MAGAYPQDKTRTGIDHMEGVESGVLPPGAEVGGVETGGSNKEIKHTPTDEIRHSDDQFNHVEKAEVSRDDPAFPSDQSLPSSKEPDHRSKALQLNKEFIESLNKRKAGLKSPAVNDNRSRALLSEFELNSTLEEACDTAIKLKESQRECEILKGQALEHQKELSDAHDFIFSLQPRSEQITESEAMAEFRSLGKAVEDWVETNLEDDIYRESIRKKRLQPAHVKRFLTCVSMPGKEASRCPNTDVYNVIAAIMKFLCIEIFDKDFYCPVEEGEMGFIDSILVSMTKLEPKRDLSTLRRWRSETFTALAGRPEFASQKERQTRYLVNELTNMLLIFLPDFDMDELAPSVYIAIIEPALSLAHQLHLSVDRFSLIWSPFAGTTRPEERSIDPSDYSIFECVDFLRAGRVMKPQAVAVVGTITYMVDLTPTLLFEAVKADAFAEPRVLNRGRILVAAGKGGDPFVPPQKDSGEPTLVAWLFETWRKFTSGRK